MHIQRIVGSVRTDTGTVFDFRFTRNSQGHIAVNSYLLAGEKLERDLVRDALIEALTDLEIGA